MIVVNDGHELVRQLTQGKCFDLNDKGEVVAKSPSEYFKLSGRQFFKHLFWTKSLERKSEQLQAKMHKMLKDAGLAAPEKPDSKVAEGMVKAKLEGADGAGGPKEPELKAPAGATPGASGPSGEAKEARGAKPSEAMMRRSVFPLAAKYVKAAFPELTDGEKNVLVMRVNDHLQSFRSDETIEGMSVFEYAFSDMEELEAAVRACADSFRTGGTGVGLASIPGADAVVAQEEVTDESMRAAIPTLADSYVKSAFKDLSEVDQGRVISRVLEHLSDFPLKMACGDMKGLEAAVRACADAFRTDGPGAPGGTQGAQNSSAASTVQQTAEPVRTEAAKAKPKRKVEHGARELTPANLTKGTTVGQGLNTCFIASVINALLRTDEGCRALERALPVRNGAFEGVLLQDNLPQLSPDDISDIRSRLNIVETALPDESILKNRCTGLLRSIEDVEKAFQSKDPGFEAKFNAFVEDMEPARLSFSLADRATRSGFEDILRRTKVAAQTLSAHGGRLVPIQPERKGFSGLELTMINLCQRSDSSLAPGKFGDATDVALHLGLTPVYDVLTESSIRGQDLSEQVNDQLRSRQALVVHVGSARSGHYMAVSGASAEGLRVIDSANDGAERTIPWQSLGSATLSAFAIPDGGQAPGQTTQTQPLQDPLQSAKPQETVQNEEKPELKPEQAGAKVEEQPSEPVSEPVKEEPSSEQSEKVAAPA